MFFKSEVPDFSPPDDFPTLRALVLFNSSCRLQGTCRTRVDKGGKYGCRRCGVEGTYIASRKHYYYYYFHRRFYHPAEPRKAKKNRADVRAVNNACTNKKQQSIFSLECGINGESMFYRVYDLYGLIPSKIS